MNFPSSTTEGLSYTCTGKACNCPGFLTTGHCKHLKQMKASHLMQNEFLADAVNLKPHKSSDTVDVIFSTGIYQWDAVKDLQNLRGKVLKVSVTVEK